MLYKFIVKRYTKIKKEEFFMLGLWIALGVVAFLIISVILWWISTYNSLVKLRNNVKESFSTMDVYMQKRYDLIPNIVETIKGYAKHERGTFEDVVKARNAAFSAGTIEEKQKAEGQLSSALKSLFALAEAYPDLKANTNFVTLQTQLQDIELEISNSRRYYNACVKEYNNKIAMFPSSIIAKKHNFEAEQMFEVDSPDHRKNVKVEF